MGWEEVTLSEVSFYRSEKIKFDEVLIDNYISTENMIADKGGIECSSSLPKSGSSNVYYKSDILVSNIRPYFKKIWFADKMGACSNDVLVFALKNNRIDATYLYYYLSTDNFFDYVMSGSNGVKMPRGNKKSIMDYRLLLPPLKTQQKIASLLSNYDKLIENNTQRIKVLESMAQELYKEWFVRLRFPGHEDVEVLDGVPEGWERVRLEDVCNITSSKRIFLSDYTSEGIPFYRGKEITLKSKNESVKSDYYIAQDKFTEIQERFGSPKTNDILITAVGTLGSVYIVKKNDGDFYFKDGNIIWLKDFKEEASLYVYYFLRSREFKHFVEGFSIGSSQKALTIDSLKKSFILYPTSNLINTFDIFIEKIINQIEILEQKQQTLKQTRDLLLPRLMSDKLNVEDLDII